VRVLLRTAATLDSGGRGAVLVSVSADPGAKSADPVAVGAATSTAAATVLVRPSTRAQRRGLLRQASPSGFKSGSLGARSGNVVAGSGGSVGPAGLRTQRGGVLAGRRRGGRRRLRALRR